MSPAVSLSHIGKVAHSDVGTSLTLHSTWTLIFGTSKVRVDKKQKMYVEGWTREKETTGSSLLPGSQVQ